MTGTTRYPLPFLSNNISTFQTIGTTFMYTTTYTCPANGLYVFNKTDGNSSGVSQDIKINGQVVFGGKGEVGTFSLYLKEGTILETYHQSPKIVGYFPM